MANFTLGELVALKYHPYFKDTTDVYIMADATLTPPIMVVTEILYPRMTEDITDKDLEPEQIKCEFYSHKSHKFESNWLLPSQVKKIIDTQSNSSKKDLHDFSASDKIESINVILKTWKIELVKKKISLSENAMSTKKDNKTVSANLNFLPPVMTIIKVEKNKAVPVLKKPVKRNRIVPPFLFKCKWFNPKTDSFSEGVFTPESLELVKNNEELVDVLHGYILTQKFFKFKNPDIPFNKGNTIGKPLRIFYNHCYYELEYFDYLTNQTESIDLTDFNKLSFTVIGNPILRFAPTFSEVHIGLTPIEFIEAEIMIKPTKATNKIFRINYIDRNDVRTTRTISNCKFFYNGNSKDIGTTKEKKMERFVKAKCFKRNGDERYFRFDGIQSIELLNI